jgi:hypothetical protein
MPAHYGREDPCSIQGAAIIAPAIGHVDQATRRLNLNLNEINIAQRKMIVASAAPVTTNR